MRASSTYGKTFPGNISGSYHNLPSYLLLAKSPKEKGALLLQVMPFLHAADAARTFSSHAPIHLCVSDWESLYECVHCVYQAPATDELQTQQSGLTTGRSTANAVLDRTLLAEIHQKFLRPLNVGPGGALQETNNY